MEPLEVREPAHAAPHDHRDAGVNDVDLAIPADYRVLRVWWSARVDIAAAASTVTVTFNTTSRRTTATSGPRRSARR